jgi:hypothetical protein
VPKLQNPPVMPALVAGIHVFTASRGIKTWMAGTSPAMTSWVFVRIERESL